MRKILTLLTFAALLVGCTPNKTNVISTLKTTFPKGQVFATQYMDNMEVCVVADGTNYYFVNYDAEGRVINIDKIEFPCEKN